MEVRKYLNEQDFDILVLLEVTPRWDEYLKGLANIYPYRKKEVRNDNFGIALLSKKKIENIEFKRLSRYGVPTIIADVAIGKEKISLIGTHPVPPTARIPFKDRNDQFQKLNEIALELEKKNEVVLVGDFNCTSFSPNFSLITKNTSLKDTRKGFGILHSWWADVEFLNLAIDHAFVTNGLAVVNRSVGPYVGSDHLPIELEIGFKAE